MSVETIVSLVVSALLLLYLAYALLRPDFVRLGSSTWRNTERSTTNHTTICLVTM